jgi:hypothetical protein
LNKETREGNRGKMTFKFTIEAETLEEASAQALKFGRFLSERGAAPAAPTKIVEAVSTPTTLAEDLSASKQAPRGRGRPAKAKEETHQVQAPAGTAAPAPDKVVAPSAPLGEVGDLQSAVAALKKVKEAKGIKVAAEVLSEFGATQVINLQAADIPEFIQACEMAISARTNNNQEETDDLIGI